MICLDNNYLILGVSEGTEESQSLVEWIEAGETLITPMPAWFEFICGPVTEDQKTTMRAFISQIVPFAEAQAVEAARLYNATRRRRSLRVDAMIAGTANMAQALLATRNRKDFMPFTNYGLVLV